METQRQLTQKEVDEEITKLKERFNKGKESQKLYDLKIEALKTVKHFVIKGNQKWKSQKKV